LTSAKFGNRSFESEGTPLVVGECNLKDRFSHMSYRSCAGRN